jgi:hypothetical protein
MGVVKTSQRFQLTSLALKSEHMVPSSDYKPPKIQTLSNEQLMEVRCQVIVTWYIPLYACTQPQQSPSVCATVSVLTNKNSVPHLFAYPASCIFYSVILSQY